MELVFVREKQTPGTVRYKEQTDEAPMVGTLYVKKYAVEKLGNPDRLFVTINADES